MNMKPTNEKHEKHEKASRKAGKILRQLDEKQLEAVAGGTCRTCGLVLQPDGVPILDI